MDTCVVGDFDDIDRLSSEPDIDQQLQIDCEISDVHFPSLITIKLISIAKTL
jgi:hypothetical protein